MKSRGNVTWFDDRNGNDDIYAQRVNAFGAMQWTVNGVPLCTATGKQYNPTSVSDGAGGAIVAWEDERSGDYDIYAQRVNASGTVQWTVNGVVLCTRADDEVSAATAMDGTGGVIVAWARERSDEWDIYAQRVLHDGTVMRNLVPVFTLTAALAGVALGALGLRRMRARSEKRK